MKTGIKMNTLQSIYKKMQVCHQHAQTLCCDGEEEEEHDFCSGRLC